MTDKTNSSSLTAAPTSSSTIVPLGNLSSVDLASLPEHQQQALMKDHLAGILNIERKAQELRVDVGGLKAALDIASQTARDATTAGNSVTITHVVESHAGRTEVIMGNTETAQAGKVGARQAGARDWTPFYVIGGLIAVVLIAAMFAK